MYVMNVCIAIMYGCNVMWCDVCMYACMYEMKCMHACHVVCGTHVFVLCDVYMYVCVHVMPFLVSVVCACMRVGMYMRVSYWCMDAMHFMWWIAFAQVVHSCMHLRPCMHASIYVCMHVCNMYMYACIYASVHVVSARLWRVYVCVCACDCLSVWRVCMYVCM